MIRVTAFVLRFVKRLKIPKYKGGIITCSELNEAEQMWVKYIQRKNFSDFLSQYLVRDQTIYKSN